MKIAQVAPLYEAVPPRLYGGTERVVAHLTDALVELGHEVTLFASAEAQTQARLAPVRDQAIRLDPAPLKSDLAAHLSQLAEVRRRADEFDVIHFHTDMIHFPMFEDMARADGHHPARPPRPEGPAGGLPPLAAVPAGLDQRRPAPAACPSPTGRPPCTTACRAELYRFNAASRRATSPSSAASRRRSGRTGRSPSPRAPGRPLKIAAKVDDADRAYFEEKIEPLLAQPAGRVRRRDRRRGRSRPSWAAPTPCCSPSTGPSRSAW